MLITPQPTQYLTPFQQWQLATYGNVVVEQGDTHHMVDDEFENGVKASEDFKYWMETQAVKQLN